MSDRREWSSDHEPVTIKTALDDYTQTNHPQLLAVREEISTLVNADSDTIFGVAKDRLETIYHDAEASGDAKTMALVVDAFSHVEMLYQANDQLVGVAVASRAAMEKAVEERDDLVSAIEEQDEMHPLIGDLIEAVREDAYYDSEMSMYDHLHDLLLDNAVENIAQLMGITDRNVANRLALLVCYGYDGSYNGSGGTPEEVMKALGRVITERLGEARV